MINKTKDPNNNNKSCKNSTNLVSIAIGVFHLILILKPPGIINMPNLPERTENQSGRAVKKPSMNMSKQNYRDLNRDWTIIIFEWFVISYFGSSYGH